MAGVLMGGTIWRGSIYDEELVLCAIGLMLLCAF